MILKGKMKKLFIGFGVVCIVALGSCLGLKIYGDYMCNKAREIADEYLENTYGTDFLYKRTDWLWIDGYFWVDYIEPTDNVIFQVNVYQKLKYKSCMDNYKAKLSEKKVTEKFKKIFAKELITEFGANARLQVRLNQSYGFERYFYDYEDLRSLLEDVTYRIFIVTDMNCSDQSKEEFKAILEENGYFPKEVYTSSLD